MITLVLSLCALTSTVDFPVTLQDETLRATVRTAAFRDGQVTTGTGTIIAQDGSHIIVLTAAHVIPNADRYEIRFWPHTAAAESVDDVTVIASSAPADVCLLRVQAPRRIPAMIPVCPAGAVPEPPFPMFTVGCSNGDPPSLDFGSALDVTDVEHGSGKGRFWVLDRRPVPGRSGGAMINPRGYVVGVCLGHGPDSGFYAHAHEIHKLCDAANLRSLYQSQAHREVVVTAALQQHDQPVWNDPANWQVKAQLTLQIDLKDDVDLPFPTPLSFTIQAPPDVQLDVDSREFTLGKPGPAEVPLHLTLTMQTPKDLALRIEPRDLPAWAALDQTHLTLKLTLNPPPKVTTTIRAEPSITGSATWVNLKEATAAFEAQISVQVDGPLGDRKLLMLQAPIGVRRLSLSDRLLRSGHQTLRVDVTASMRPAPHINEFQFMFDGQPQGAIEIQMRSPLTIRVVGPPPAHLALSHDGHVRSRITAPFAHDDSPTNLRVQPVVLGAPRGLLAGLPAARLEPSSGIRLVGDTAALPLFAESSFAVAPDASVARSFFRDAVVDAQLKVEPATACPALRGTTHTIRLVSEAPFKRILNATLLLLFVILIVYLPYRFFRALTASTILDEAAPDIS